MKLQILSDLHLETPKAYDIYQVTSAPWAHTRPTIFAFLSAQARQLHWNPSVDERSRDARHEGSRILNGFTTDLSGEACFRSDKVRVWAFGHTHHNCDFAVEREGASPIRLVTNQRCYYFNQAGGFDDIKTMDV